MTDYCLTCLYEDYDGAEEPCINCVGVGGKRPSEYLQKKPPKPITNADRIRSMTDEALAELFMQKYDGADSFTCPVPHPCPPEKEASCRECFLDWLKEETDHD